MNKIEPTILTEPTLQLHKTSGLFRLAGVMVDNHRAGRMNMHSWRGGERIGSETGGGPFRRPHLYPFK